MNKAKTSIGIALIVILIIVCANYLDNRAIAKEQEEWKQEQIEKYDKTFEQSEKEAKQLTEEIEKTNQRAREMMKNW
jgi:peptidoglycan hydrolase CwlO-like protein